ncbi:FHA domain-containing protein [Myxococcota bacterium]|nr:FHA domain-containing protein [Myxococcota bacterium]
MVKRPFGALLDIMTPDSPDNNKSRHNPLGSTKIFTPARVVSLPVSTWIRQRFIEHFENLKTLSGKEENRSHIVAALGEDGSFSYASRMVTEKKCTDIILGRHPSCQIALQADPSISLRHLLVRIYHRPKQKPIVKILDLHSEIGFYDESGTKVTALKCEGLFFIKVGQYAVFIFENDNVLTPLDALDGWNNLPSREIIDMRAQDTPQAPKPHINPRLRLVAEDERPITFVTRVVGPMHLGNLSKTDERAIGFLLISGNTMDHSIPFSSAALARGVLIGRYTRCDIGYQEVPFSINISRIQLMLLLDETGFWAIDTASTNGNLFQNKPFHSILLNDGAEISMANEYILRWRTA